jgi:hypothetical protein
MASTQANVTDIAAFSGPSAEVVPVRPLTRRTHSARRPLRFTVGPEGHNDGI